MGISVKFMYLRGGWLMVNELFIHAESKRGKSKDNKKGKKKLE